MNPFASSNPDGMDGHDEQGGESGSVRSLSAEGGNWICQDSVSNSIGEIGRILAHNEAPFGKGPFPGGLDRIALCK